MCFKQTITEREKERKRKENACDDYVGDAVCSAQTVEKR